MDEIKCLELFCKVLRSGKAERLSSFLADNCVYTSMNNNQSYQGKADIIERFNYVNKCCKENGVHHIANIAVVSAVDETKELEYNVGKKCIATMMNTDNGYESILFLDFNKNGLVKKISFSIVSGYEFEIISKQGEETVITNKQTTGLRVPNEDGEKFIPNFNNGEIMKIIIQDMAHAALTISQNGSKQTDEYLTDKEYGLVKEKPIYCNMIDGSKEYLDKIRTYPKLERLSWERTGSTAAQNINGMIDIYVGSINGKYFTTFYINMYAETNSNTAPVGFCLLKY